MSIPQKGLELWLSIPLSPTGLQSMSLWICTKGLKESLDHEICTVPPRTYIVVEVWAAYSAPLECAPSVNTQVASAWSDWQLGVGTDKFLSTSVPLLILPIDSIPYQFSYRFLSSSLSGKNRVLHSFLHQKQPFYFSPKLCLHKSVNMNIFNLNIQQKTVHAACSCKATVH